MTSTQPSRARWSPLVRLAMVVAMVASSAAFQAVAIPGASAQGGPQAVTLRIASYNIHAGAGQDNVFDLDRTAAAITSLHADMVGLQEVDVHWDGRSQWRDTLQELGARLHMRVAFAPIYDLDPPAASQPRRQYGVALLSRYQVVARENHEIARLSTQVPNSPPALAPGFLEAVVQVQDIRMHVYVTHLDFRGDPAMRMLQVSDTRRILMQDPPDAVQLLLGDLNAEPGAPELGPLWQDVRDVWADAPVRSGIGLTYPAAVPTKRIDYVTASPNVAAVAAAVPADGLSAIASDHRPMVATVRVPLGSENDQ